jgi:transposase InsO family protein
MAIALRSPPKGCIFHSDRGSQYCSHDYQKILREHGFKASPLAYVNIRCPLPDRRVYTPRRGQRMSGKGNCYDNAAALRRENSLPDCFLILLTFFKTSLSAIAAQ